MLRTLALAVSLCLSMGAHAQAWPTKPIRLLLQFREVIAADLEKWRRVVREANIKSE